MSARKCEHDQSLAKYSCTTHNAYYCELHYMRHISDGKPHVTSPIYLALTQPEFEHLQTEAIKRIKALENAKQQVASQAAQLIAKIEQTCMASIENLDQLIQYYRAYMTENIFDQQTLQNITKILTTRFKIQIDQSLAVNFKEESEEENKKFLMQSIRELIKERKSPKQPKIETSSKHQVKQILSN
jgi:hypothetical protein